jgi:dTDP-4-amino-4,6-dideoxygalactose transaminase
VRIDDFCILSGNITIGSNIVLSTHAVLYSIADISLEDPIFTYLALPSSSLDNFPNAHKMADSMICLPMHRHLTEEDIQRVINCIVK